MSIDCKHFRFYKEKPHKLNMYCVLHKQYTQTYCVHPCFCKDFTFPDGDVNTPLQLELFDYVNKK